MFKGSLKENIDPLGTKSDEEISRELARLGLSFFSRESSKNEIIDENSNQLDFKIKSGGANVSNGERQLINFLRIYFCNKDILCLDEATSNMDAYIGI